MRSHVLAWTFVTLATFAAGCGAEKDTSPPVVARAPAAEPLPAAPSAAKDTEKAVTPAPVPQPAPVVKADPVPEPKVETQPPAPVPAPVPPVVAPEPPPVPPKPEPAPPAQEPVPPSPPEPAPPAPRATEPVTPPPVAPTAPPVASKDAYVGWKSCQKCHFAQMKAWKKSPLSRALDALKPTVADDAVRFDAKQRAGLDPARDYSTDKTCLECHTTGYGEGGGYPAAPEVMGCVSCESCHGPGARYVAHKLEIVEKDKDAKIPVEQLVALGLVIPDASVCARCHNDRNPTHADDRFDFETAKAKVHPKK
jgi:Cytochrome c554 and c-prime